VNMKKLIYSLSILTFAVVMSCNDDDEVARDLLLTRITENGVTTIELFYDLGRKLTRTNIYSTGDLFAYMLYEYNEDGIAEARQYYAAGHQVALKAVFTLDSFGRVNKIEYYSSPSDFEEVVGIHTFSYDPSGQLKSKRMHVPNNTNSDYREDYTYDAAGNRINAKRLFNPSKSNEYVISDTESTPGEKALPEHWNSYVFLLDITGFDDHIWEMVNISSHRKSWNSDGDMTSDWRADATERVFNNDGYLTRQVVTRMVLLNPSPNTVTELTYEYTE
jgi:hypothetical protein